MPLVVYVSGFFTSLVMRPINKKIGRKVTKYKKIRNFSLNFKYIYEITCMNKVCKTSNVFLRYSTDKNKDSYI